MIIANKYREAMFYQQVEETSVKCLLCPHYCNISEGHEGACQVRKNIGGKLFTEVYHSTIAQQIDPIEKKSLYHFHPGTSTFSIATHGCNFTCAYCANWEISQMKKEKLNFQTYEISPEKIVNQAILSGCQSIAYTYTEPSIFFELSYQLSKLAHSRGLKNVYKSNGFISLEALETLLPYIDAINVDLKTFTEKTYRFFGGRLAPVLETLEYLKSRSIWLEISTVVIPEINDSEEELQEMANFIYGKLGKDTPWHLVRFFPDYKMNKTPLTPLPVIERTYSMAKKTGLQYVYCSSIGSMGYQHTFCPECRTLLVERQGESLKDTFLKGNQCPNCSTFIPGTF